VRLKAKLPVYAGADEIDNVLVRMPETVHRAAKAVAKARGLSANTFFVEAIAVAAGLTKEVLSEPVVIGYRWANGKTAEAREEKK
jgi:hypothetical protein